MPTAARLRSNAPRLLRSWASALLFAGVCALVWPASLGGQVEYVMVAGESMEPGLHTGDLVVVRESDDLEIGDTVAFRVPDGEVGEGAVVIHRIVGGGGDGWQTQGDNRDLPDPWTPTDADVVGERWVMVPGLGNAFAKLRNPLPLGILAGGITFALLALPPKRRPATS
jgi:signal peptidase I